MSTGSHWYNDKAESCHEVMGKNGKMRRTTIRDAKENKWFPSVTGVLGILSKPQLETWKMRQCIDATLLTLRKPQEQVGDYYDRVIEAAFQQVDDAADLGTNIHKAIEQHFQGLAFDPALSVYVQAVDKWVKDNGVTFDKHELRLVSKSHGFAGTTDALISRGNGRGVLDFKSRKSDPKYPMSPYEDQVVQIAAYDMAHFGGLADADRIGVNVFISTTEPGRIEATWYDHNQLRSAWQAFESALTLWRFVKGYDPR